MSYGAPPNMNQQQGRYYQQGQAPPGQCPPNRASSMVGISNATPYSSVNCGETCKQVPNPESFMAAPACPMPMPVPLAQPQQPQGPACSAQGDAQYGNTPTPIGYRMEGGGGGRSHGHRRDPYSADQSRAMCAQIDVNDPRQRITRKYLLSWSASLAQMGSASPDLNKKALWFSKDPSIYQRRLANCLNNTERAGNLKSVVLADARVIWMYNTFPITMGVEVTGMSGNTYTAHGARYPIVVPPTSTPMTFDKGLRTFKPKSIIESTIFLNYAGLTEETLRKGLLRIEDENTDFPPGDPRRKVVWWQVPENHTIMKLLRMNAQNIGLNLDEYDRVRDRSATGREMSRIELPDHLVTSVLKLLEERVLAKLPYVCMEGDKFRARLCRADVPVPRGSNAAKDMPAHYMSTEGMAATACGEQTLFNEYFHVPHTVEVCLEVSYVITGL